MFQTVCVFSRSSWRSAQLWNIHDRPSHSFIKNIYSKTFQQQVKKNIEKNNYKDAHNGKTFYGKLTTLIRASLPPSVRRPLKKKEDAKDPGSDLQCSLHLLVPFFEHQQYKMVIIHNSLSNFLASRVKTIWFRYYIMSFDCWQSFDRKFIFLTWFSLIFSGRRKGG